MIFIIDDDDAARDSLCLLLEADGFEAQQFAAGRPFLETTRPIEGDCLILDLHMPGMSGLEVLEELRRRGWRLPTIILSGRLDGVARTRALSGGAFAVIEKPARPDELLAAIRSAIGHRT
jgi:two-component system, LuxR family, response regulator FixJ